MDIRKIFFTLLFVIILCCPDKLISDDKDTCAQQSTHRLGNISRPNNYINGIDIYTYGSGVYINNSALANLQVSITNVTKGSATETSACNQILFTYNLLPFDSYTVSVEHNGVLVLDADVVPRNPSY